MAIRFAAASGLALAAALFVAQPARAQFFSFYEMSPRQIIGMLADDGYEIRGAMLRRGDVYVCDVVSISGRPARLIVDAHDGHIVDRYATRGPQHWRNPDDDSARYARPPRDVGGDESDRDADQGDNGTAGRQTALGDLFNQPSRVYGGDTLFGPKPSATPSSDDTPAPKPHHHAAKKHKEPTLAKAPSVAPTPDDTPTAANPDKSSVAEVAPGSVEPDNKKPTVETVAPAAEVKKPAVDASKAETPPKPAASSTPAPVKAVVQNEPAAVGKPAVAAKPEPSRKKINDLPVGTLD